MDGMPCADQRPLAIGTRADGRIRPSSTDRGPADIAGDAPAVSIAPQASRKLGG